MKTKITLLVLLFIVVFVGIGTYSEFMAQHTYYSGIINSSLNRQTFGIAILSSLIPIGWLFINKKAKFLSITIALFIGLMVFGLLHVSARGGLIGTGLLMFTINSLLLFATSVYYIVGSLALGLLIFKKIFPTKKVSVETVFISLGGGIAVYMLLTNVLVMTRMFYPIITWILFAGFALYIVLAKKQLLEVQDVLLERVRKLTHLQNVISFQNILLLILTILSIVYYYYGFQLSFIPYPTAWDANHAYMYTPKVFAENYGIVGDTMNGGSLWMSYIAFWFSLIEPIKNHFWLTPDTFAVEMNFLSGILVLIFGLGLLNEVIRYLSGSKEGIQLEVSDHQQFPQLIKDFVFYGGWIILLLRLTSGMGAFLVFIDNKTDLGVFAMTILALFSAFLFLNEYKNDSSDKKLSITNIIYENLSLVKYIVFSGFFFVVAVLSKPTALLDVLLFGLFLSYIRFGPLLLLGGLFFGMGFVIFFAVLNVQQYIPQTLGLLLLLIGTATIVVYLIFVLKKNLKKLIYLSIRVISFLFFLLLYRVPVGIIDLSKSGDFSSKAVVSKMLMGANVQRPALLLASTETPDLSTRSREVCSLDRIKVDPEQLFTGLKEIDGGGLVEDVQRYVGYGQKEFQNPWRGVLFPNDGACYAFNGNISELCKNFDKVQNGDVTYINSVYAKVQSGDELQKFLSGVLVGINAKAVNSGDVDKFNDTVKKLRLYVDSYVVKTKDGSVFVPYVYLVPFNTVFNWSLQNLSSYYTDIGFIRMFFLVFLVVGLVYGLLIREKNLTGISLVTLAGRGIRWIIGGGILWYGIGLIAWTMLSFVLFMYYLLSRAHKSQTSELLITVFAGLLLCWIIIQFGMNFLRISSQGASGPFSRYKISNGTVYNVSIEKGLQQEEKIKTPYLAKDVFDLQFPHYNKFINTVKDRKDEDGVFIAGTYIQYFLHNQENLYSDGMLGSFWQRVVDGDLCKAYLRLKEKKLGWIVIDPNIATVVMGEGNQTLMNRFFAKLRGDGSIWEDGAMTSLIKLMQKDYIEFFYSNNLGAKYAFTLTDKEFDDTFGVMNDEQRILGRAKLSLARFFPQNPEYASSVGMLFQQRLQNGKALGDLADVYGKIIDENTLLPIAANFLASRDQTVLKQQLSGRNNDELFVISQYIGLYNLMYSQDQQSKTSFQESVKQIIMQSLGGSSQLIIFKIK